MGGKWSEPEYLSWVQEDHVDTMAAGFYPQGVCDSVKTCLRDTIHACHGKAGFCAGRGDVYNSATPLSVQQGQENTTAHSDVLVSDSTFSTCVLAITILSLLFTSKFLITNILPPSASFSSSSAPCVLLTT